MPQRSNLFKSHWSNQWLTFRAVTSGICSNSDIPRFRYGAFFLQAA